MAQVWLRPPFKTCLLPAQPCASALDAVGAHKAEKAELARATGQLERNGIGNMPSVATGVASMQTQLVCQLWWLMQTQPMSCQLWWLMQTQPMCQLWWLMQ